MGSNMLLSVFLGIEAGAIGDIVWPSSVALAERSKALALIRMI